MRSEPQLTLGTDTERLLSALQRTPGEFVPDLYDLRMMVHSRVSDLRKRGHVIECRIFGPGDYRYRLVRPCSQCGSAPCESPSGCRGDAERENV